MVSKTLFLKHLGLCTVIASLALAASARAQGFRDDKSTPAHNAVVNLGHCSGTMISNSVILTAAHCLPRGWRQPAPEGAGTNCTSFPDQNRVAGSPHRSEADWQPIARPPGTALPRVSVTATIGRREFQTTLTHYAIPACADIALLRTFQITPATIATPMAVLTGPIAAGDTPFFSVESASLSYAGWGRTEDFPQGQSRRQTAEVGYWARNRCFIFALPPRRTPGGPRIISGDSGSPLIMETSTGRLVAGVLFGSGLPDPENCDPPRPPLAEPTAIYTPTYRGKIGQTDATDLGAWLRRLVPEANHRTMP